MLKPSLAVKRGTSLRVLMGLAEVRPTRAVAMVAICEKETMFAVVVMVVIEYAGYSMV